MKIISETHDYYDVVQAQGQDPLIVWIRKPEEYEFAEWKYGILDASNSRKPWPFPSFTYYKRYHRVKEGGPYTTKWRIIGFCGKIYPVFLFYTTLTDDVSEKPVICFNIQEIDEYVESHFKHKEVEEYKIKVPKRKHWRHSTRLKYWPSDMTRANFEEFFALCEEKKCAFEQMFAEKRCPVFVAGANKITYNAVLKDLEFFRVFDPFTAFQEIAMYFGNMAVPLKPVPAIPDKIMVGVKGFDKYSFRKEKKK